MILDMSVQLLPYAYIISLHQRTSKSPDSLFLSMKPTSLLHLSATNNPTNVSYAKSPLAKRENVETYIQALHKNPFFSFAKSTDMNFFRLWPSST